MSDLNQIEEIEKLYAKPKSYKIPKDPKEGQTQVDVHILPLGIESMGLMNIKEDSSIAEISKNVKLLWAVSLGISEENAGKIAVSFMEDLMSCFMDANDFKESDLKKTGIKDFIKAKQEQTKKKEEDANQEPDRKA